MTMAEYYYTQGTDRHGPIDLTELQSLVSVGQVASADYYWTTGMADWLTVGSSSLFAAPAPTIPETAATPAWEAPAATTPAWEAPVADVPAQTPLPAAGGLTAPAAAWSPNADTTPRGGDSDRAVVQRVAAKMPKPIWLLTLAITTILGGLITLIGIITIPIAGLYIWAAVMLFQANSALENARQTGSVESLEKAAGNFNTFFAIGAVTIILSFVLTVGFIVLGFSSSAFNF